MADHNELGIKGEEMAVRYLAQKGYRILARNYRFKHLEIDIITKLKGLLVIVEVKTRQSTFMAGPEVTVNRKKQKSIVKVTNEYITKQLWEGETRFDIISIIMEQGNYQIEHLEDAFYPL